MRIKILAPLLFWGVSLIGCGGAGEETSSSSSSSSTSSSGASSSSGTSTTGLEKWHFVLGLNVGGSTYRDSEGLTFEADRYFTGGNAQVVTNAIAGTQQQPLFQSERWGDLDYEIPLEPGHYKIKLKFVEMFWDASNSRLIDVAVEDKILAQNLDIYAQVGKFSAYEIESSSVVVNDGFLSIRVNASQDNGTLSAIEIYADKDNETSFSELSITAGEDIYDTSCAQCHGTSGDGNGVFPSLIKSECTSCASASALISKISLTMPLNGDHCTGDCARNVAGFILHAFNDEGPSTADCRVKSAPIRRLTRFEYNNTIYDLFADDTRPGNDLPSEEIGNGFGNDANSMAVSSFLAEQYAKVAEGIAERVVNNTAQWQGLHSCVQTLQSSNQQSCADQIIERLLPRVFRRTATSAELQTYKDLQRSLVRNGSDFKQSISGVIEAVLQAPEFLYRVEKGAIVDGRLKPTSEEMASRLSYFFWGSMPDDQLLSAAANGQLSTPAQVKAQAERMLADARSRNMIRYFFDAYLPISSLNHLERDPEAYPDFNALVGSLMREETQRFMEHMIFEGAGDWASALTAPYTFMNETLARFYGISGVFGDQFQEVPMDSRRLGVLTHAGIMAGTTHSGHTNPVVRGAYVMKKLLCVDIPLPSGDILAQIKPPDPSSGLTGRDRYSQHSQDPVCKTCHDKMDPVGLVFEHFDPVGRYRTHENNVLIDASGALPGTGIQVSNAVELVTAIANDPRTHQCFAYNWANFAYGKTIGASESCVKETVTTNFADKGYDIQSLLVDLTQTDAFLYLPASHRQ